MKKIFLLLVLFSIKSYAPFYGPGGSSSSSSSSASDPTTVSISSDVTLTNNSLNFVDTTAARTLTLPAPVASGRIWVKDASWLAGTNAITFARTSGNLEGVAQSYVYRVNGGGVLWVSNGVAWFLN